MVKLQGPGDYERLDALVRGAVAEHDLNLDVTGWTRRTYDVYAPSGHRRSGDLLLRVESIATTTGTITVFDERGMAIAAIIAEGLEREFEIPEATIVRS